MSRKFDPFAARPRGSGCEPFVTALDVRSRGALADSALPVLEAHLAGCEVCRQRAERLAVLPPPRQAEPVDWQEARAALLRRLRDHRRAPWLVVALLLALPVLNGALQLAIGDTPTFSLRMLPGMLIVLACVLVVLRFSTRRAARMLATADLIGSYRRDLEQLLREYRWALAPTLVVGVLSTLHAIVLLAGSALDTPRLRLRLINAIVTGLVMLGLSLYSGKEMRRIRRALRELG